jgi:dTMP kinase
MTSNQLPEGLFITLEGGEGSGKSTLIAQLADHLISQGFPVVKTREPGGTRLAEVIRQWLLHRDPTVKIGAQAELLLFLAARAQHIEEVIRPSLAQKKIVLCDRFNDSTVAYQGVARALDPMYVQQLCQLVCRDIQPHLTLFLDVLPSIGLMRTQHLSKEHADSGQLDRIESEALEFHENVRQAFLAIASQEPSRVVRIDANQPQPDVREQALTILEHFIYSRKQL